MAMTTNTHVILGTGPLGLAIMDELVSAGKQVTLVNRSGRINEPLPDGVSIAAGDVMNAQTVAETCQGASVVYMCANPPYSEWPEKYPPLIKSLIEGISQTNARLIMGDNLYMYGDPNGQPIQEGMPYTAETRKGRARADAAEQLLQAHAAGKIRVVIGRASDFYGPRVLQSALGEMVFGAALAGKPANLIGDMDQLHSYTYIRDFARGLVTLGQHDEALGQVWHVPNAEAITTRQFIDMIRAEIGQAVKIRSAGPLLVRILGLFNADIREMQEMMYEFTQPFVLDDSRIRQTFGASATPYQQGIKETVAWYRQNWGA